MFYIWALAPTVSQGSTYKLHLKVLQTNFTCRYFKPVLCLDFALTVSQGSTYKLHLKVFQTDFTSILNLFYIWASVM